MAFLKLAKEKDSEADKGNIKVINGIVWEKDPEESSELLEELSELEHKQWEHWSKSIAEKEKISKEKLESWKKDWIPYEDLSEEKKEFDREWARKVIKIFEKFSYKEPDNSSVEKLLKDIKDKVEKMDSDTKQRDEDFINILQRYGRL